MANTQNPNKISSSFLVLIMDTAISTIASVMSALYSRWQFHPIIGFDRTLLLWFAMAVFSSLFAFLIIGTHKIVIKHFSFRSISKLAISSLIKDFILGFLLLLGVFHFGSRTIEVMLIFADTILTLLCLILARLFIISLHEHFKSDYEVEVSRLGIMVYGTSDKAVSMVIRLVQSKHYKVLGFLTRNKLKGGQIIQDHRVYYFETEEDVERLKINLGVESILFPTEKEADEEQNGLVSMCLHRGIHLLLSPRIEETDFGGLSQHSIKEVIDNDFIPDGMSGFERYLKRGIDLCLSTILLVVFTPTLIACWIAIKIGGGPGPAIYKQERIGRFGRPFNIYKFRSMRIDAEADGPRLLDGEDDPRLTKAGKFLRQHHLDELPQLFNVFRGDMAFVGYRPERKYFIDKIMDLDPRYYYLYQIRPGVTSYATLRNGYTDSMEKMLRRLEFDLYYLRHRSLWFDIKILWLTFTNIIFGKKF